MEEIANAEPMIRKAMTIEEVFMKSDDDRRMYELREKGRKDFENSMLLAEERGIEKGIEKGKKEGIQEGIKKGFEEAKISIARSMLANGMSLDDVAKFTMMTIEELRKL